MRAELGHGGNSRPQSHVTSRNSRHPPRKPDTALRSQFTSKSIQELVPCENVPCEKYPGKVPSKEFPRKISPEIVPCEKVPCEKVPSKDFPRKSSLEIVPSKGFPRKGSLKKVPSKEFPEFTLFKLYMCIFRQGTFSSGNYFARELFRGLFFEGTFSRELFRGNFFRKLFHRELFQRELFRGNFFRKLLHRELFQRELICKFTSESKPEVEGSWDWELGFRGSRRSAGLRPRLLPS